MVVIWSSLLLTSLNQILRVRKHHIGGTPPMWLGLPCGLIWNSELVPKVLSWTQGWFVVLARCHSGWLRVAGQDTSYLNLKLQMVGQSYTSNPSVLTITLSGAWLAFRTWDQNGEMTMRYAIPINPESLYLFMLLFCLILAHFSLNSGGLFKSFSISTSNALTDTSHPILLLSYLILLR